MNGPDAELLRMTYLAGNAPLWADISEAEQDAYTERVLAVRSFSELGADDQALIRRAIAQVDAGLSQTLQHHAGGDWAAEDAMYDALAGDAPEAKALPAADDAGWVGV